MAKLLRLTNDERLLSLLILIEKATAKEEPQETIPLLYLANLRSVNNWDLVDLSAPQILGPYLISRDRGLLYESVRSEVMLLLSYM